MSRRRLKDFFQLGSIAGVITQMRPPQPSDFGSGGPQSPIVINGVTGEAWIYVNGVMVRLNAINATSFGVSPTASDNSVPLLAAIAAAQANGPGTTLFIPRGQYLHSQPIVVAGTPIQIRGEGSSSGLYSPATATTGTELKYTGAAGATQITFSLCQASHGLRGIAINGNGLAANGLIVDGCTYGIYEDVSITGTTSRGQISRCTVGQSCSWNVYRSFTINGSYTVCGLWVTGSGVTNSCHNTFQDYLINFGGAANGIDLGYCDNNRFIGIYESRDGGGTGFGVQTKPAEAPGFPLGNMFIHLQASAGGWSQAAGSGWNTILGYDRANGQPAPINAANAPLLVLDGWGTWNTIVAGGAGAAGGADVRSVVQVNGGAGVNFASMIIGYQGTSANFFDANVHTFRDSAQGNGATIQSGSVFLPAGRSYNINATQVVGSRVTGYAAMTGSPDKATVYGTGTVTLAQLAGRVAQLQADLTAHGLIGA